jgi:hypothetical protein
MPLKTERIKEKQQDESDRLPIITPFLLTLLHNLGLVRKPMRLLVAEQQGAGSERPGAGEICNGE